MTLKNEPRREPSLADLEAFERLLRDSLKADGPEAATQPATTASPQPAITADSAMAEFNRLVEAPVVFEQPGAPPSVSRISQIEQALRSDLDKPPVVPPAPAPVNSAPRDPLLDFEEELRRFEAMSRPQQPANPVEPVDSLRGAYAGEAAAQGWPAQTPAAAAPAPAQAPAHDALEAAESRLNAEAEAAAYAGGAAMAGAAAGGAKRSRGIFLALGGVAVAGLAVIAGLTLFSGSKSSNVAGGKVPVVAAKTEPAKEKPANPGGLEIPDQNKQVLAARNAPAGEARPAQVVNQTEQPVDLNQIARRDSVRIVAPSPFQQPTPEAPATSPASALPTTTPTPAPAPGEPRRVQSVRIADSVAPPPAVTPSAPSPVGPGIGAGSIAGIAAGATAARPVPATPAVPPGAQAAIRATPSAPASPAAVPTPLPVPPSAPAASREDSSPKVEARPQSPVTPQRPTPAATTPPRPVANAPLPLGSRPATASPSPAAAAPRTATAPANGGGFAVQLASRPSEADAQNAGRQLAQRYSEQVGGKTPVVVRGEANGQTVYRVRVTGFDRAEANAACDKIRAAGGACFVTRQ